jgi:hypothetical protein
MEEGIDPKYSGAFLFPKSNKELYRKMRATIDRLIEEAKEKMFNGKIPKGFRDPLQDGDERYDEKGDEAYKGMWFVNANCSAKSKVDVVGEDLNSLESKTELYSGGWGRVSITFMAYDKGGGRGIGAYLNNIQVFNTDETMLKIKKAGFDIEPLAGGASAKDDFAEFKKDAEEDDDFAEEKAPVKKSAPAKKSAKKVEPEEAENDEDSDLW